MQKGQIRVQTENIFPIIKKFLYSEHDIFLRELVSNAMDATQKLKTLSSIGEAKGEIGDLRVNVSVNAKEKTITIEDKGVGMTKEEVDKYLNQVAFSGAEEFLAKYKDASIIGHFGLGFYSAFMVAEKVEVITQSYNNEAATVYWSCDGSPEFELFEVEKKERGTKIILHINEESKEFLEAYKTKSTLQKFCKFLPTPIYYIDENEEKKEDDKTEPTPINNTNPIWTKKPSELTKEDYEGFYRELYPFGETPLFWIHLNVDYPFNLTGILYFPTIKQSYEIQKDKIQLYCNQVFVTDEVKDIVPEFLMLLHGVIDSPDIPLNVSRSYLQGDPNVKKINNYITKKVAEKLEEIFNKERGEFETKWESLGLFVKYGMMTDDKFAEKANKFFVMQEATQNSPKEEAVELVNEEDSPNSEEASSTPPLGGKVAGTFYTLDEYKTATSSLQTNKEGKQIILYSTNPVQQDAYIQAATAKGFKVIKMDTLVDASFINTVEMKWEKTSFVRVDADIADNLIDKQENTNCVLSADETEKLKSLFALKPKDITVNVEVKGLSTVEAPVIATRPEFMRRMKDMAAIGGGGMMNFYGQMPDEVTLTVNGNHPIYQSILKEADIQLQENKIKNLADLALLSQGLLKGADLTNFINRSVGLMN